MNPHEQYLWDGSGEPDPLIAELERELAPLRHTPRDMPGPQIARLDRSRSWARRWAVAALLALGALAAWLARPAPSAPGWTVAVGAGPGAPRLEGSSVEAWPAERTEIRAGGLTLALNPYAVAVLGSADGPAPAVTLERGQLRAELAGRGLEVRTLHGPVRLTPGASGQVQVWPAMGRVVLDRGQARVGAGDGASRMLAGMECSLAEDGPGVPVRLAAGEQVRGAVAMLSNLKAQGKAADFLASLAGPEDAATLWNAARRVGPDQAEPLLLKLSELVPPPGGWAKEKVLRLHPGLMDAWWDEIARGR